jgi:hypothetical protein
MWFRSVLHLRIRVFVLEDPRNQCDKNSRCEGTCPIKFYVLVWLLSTNRNHIAVCNG